MEPKLCFIDVETTGTDPKLHAITQLAGVIVCPLHKGNGYEFNYKIKPHDSAVIDSAALLATGQSLEEFATYDAPSKVLCDFTRTLDTVVDKFDKRDKLFFVGYNAHFDDGFLRSFFLRQGHKFYGSYFWWPPIDVAMMAMLFLRRRRHLMPQFNLSTVYEEIMGKPMNMAHDALQDIKQTKELYDAILRKEI